MLPTGCVIDKDVTFVVVSFASVSYNKPSISGFVDVALTIQGPFFTLRVL